VTVAIDTQAVLPYVGNGTASVFPITFPTFEEETIEASVADSDGNTTDLEIDTDFTLSSIGIRNTNGSLTLVDADQEWLTPTGKLKTGYTLFIKFVASAYQPMTDADWGAFAPQRITRTLDRFAMSIAAVKAAIENALSLQLGDTGVTPVLPPLAGAAGKILQVNATEDGFEYGVTSDQIEDWRNETSDFRDDAETYKIAAQAAAVAAAASQAAALVSQTAAASSATSAANSATASANSAIGAATSEANAEQAVTDAAAARDAAVTAQGLAEDARDAAIAAAEDTEEVEALRDETEGFRNEAETFKNQAQTAETNAETAEANAELAEANAELAAVDAANAALTAEMFMDDAEQAASQAELFANLQLYTSKIEITFADSPFTVDDDTHEDTLIIVDDAGGDVVINLPPIIDTNDQPAWKVGFMKKAATGNKFTLTPNGANTIAGNASLDVEDPGLGVLVYPSSPTNWFAKYFLSVIAADGFVLTGGALNFGDPGTDGTWRIRQDGTQLKFEQRQSGSWEESDVLNPPA
jgi:hypothetical protein